MKIGQPVDISPVSTGHISPTSAKSSSTSIATLAAIPGVAVTVSTFARTLGQIANSDSSEVDMDKVNAVRSAIEDGTYKVNPEAIADKLLAGAQEMLRQTRSS